ncbi:TPA: fimbrial protein [Burkholderia cepacia]
MLMVLLSTPAFSAGMCVGDPQPIFLNFPNSIPIPPSTPVGAVVAHSNFSARSVWSCRTDPLETLTVHHVIYPILSRWTGMTYTGQYAPWGGVPIYETGVPGVGIGAIARITETLSSGESFDYPARAVQAKETGDTTHIRIGFANHKIGLTGVVFFVKTGPGITGGTIRSSGVVLGSIVDNHALILASPLSVELGEPINIKSWTCTTPDVDVTMGSFKTTDFPRAGSLSPGAGASVPIRLLNCPALGAGHTIQYRIDPTSGTVARNVAALTGGESSAKGLGIQLFDAYGKVFPLSQNQQLSNFDSNVGGNYVIPLTARYYATGLVTAGPANSTMTLTMSYQ